MKIMLRYIFVATVSVFSHTQCMEQRERRESLDVKPTLGQNIVIGSLTGVTEVAVSGQVLTYMANQIIDKKALSKNPMDYYRGSLVNAAGMAPITAIQKVGNTYGQASIRSWQGQELSDMQKTGVAFLAGAASALAATPSESIPVYMQQPENMGISTMQATKNLGLKSLRGFWPTAGRDGFFTVGYLELAHIVQEKSQAICGESAVVKVGSGIGAGLVTAVVTHPCAVIKTKLQKDPHSKVYKNSLDVMRRVYAEDGLRGFTKGLSARGTRVTIAIPLMSEAAKWYSSFFSQLNT